MLRCEKLSRILRSGVDFATISQWLGHAGLNTTMRYARADLDLKRRALAQGACGYINLFQNLGTEGDFNLEVLDPPSNTLIYHLGGDLLDREAPVHSSLILSRRSFRLPSGALLMFGEGSYQAVVTSIDRRGNSHPLFASEQVWDAQHRSISEESIKFNAVAAISGTELVSARYWAAPIQHSGLYVEWFKIE